jgi:transglutaminase-like putative cysteine protease
MRYEIKTTIAYDYAEPSAHARTLVRLLPSNLTGRQTVSARLLTIDPVPAERRDATDFFGNAMTVVVYHGPIDRIELTLSARADRLAPPPGLDLSPRHDALSDEIAAIRGIGPDAPHHFLGASPRVPASDAIAGFARAQVDPSLTAMETVETVGRAIHDTMRFQAGVTDVDTPPDAAFASRIGVCQDFSHIMIAGLRALGIPAGYVSGFLRTRPPPGQPRLEGADAMHAWVRAWCGADAGWIEYDPTNATPVGQDHIAVAHGRDYSDVAPVKGALRTAGQQTSRHSVDVHPL